MLSRISSHLLYGRYPFIGKCSVTADGPQPLRSWFRHWSCHARIATDLQLKLPDRNSIIKDSPLGKIGMYTRFVEFANFHIPLLKFLLCVLEYYQINLSQLSVIDAAKISHFELMCHVVGHVPTVGTFCHFYVNSISNGWLSFSKCSGADDPCYVSKKFDSLKNWNNHFFWIDVAMFLLSISWFYGVSIVKDPLPVKDVVDLLCVDLLNVNRIVIQKYLETFLCLVGLSRSFTDNDVLPTLLYDDEEMGLLNFVKSTDPFKVKICERTLANYKVSLLTETEGRVISPSADIIFLVDHTIQDELKAHGVKKKKMVAFVARSPPAKRARTKDVTGSDTRPAIAGKSPTTLRRLIKQGANESIGFGSAASATEYFASSSITPISDHEYEDDYDHGDN
nr:putative transposase (putative), gypsy type [Tanacetum cinerariifolium]